MSSVLHSLDHEWEWHRPLLGPSYWTQTFHSIHVASDFPPPLSDIQARYPSAVQRVLDGISQLGLRSDCSDWEIYFLGLTCVYVNHAKKALSTPDQSLDGFVLQVDKWDTWESQYGPVTDKRTIQFEYVGWVLTRVFSNRKETQNGAGILGISQKPYQPLRRPQRSGRGSVRATGNELQ